VRCSGYLIEVFNKLSNTALKGFSAFLVRH
jgi:hypothetical protein